MTYSKLEQKDLYDDVAEAGLISICSNNPDCYLEISHIVNSDDFGRLTNKILFRSLSALIEEDPDNIDAKLVRNKAIEMGYSDFDEITSNGEYVESIFASKISKRNLKSVTKRIKELSTRRKIINSLADIEHIAYDGERSSVQAMTEIENSVVGTMTSINNEEGPKVLGEGFWEWANERADNPCDMVGISLGLPRFDRAIGGGVRRGSVALITARPKTFKSGTAINIARSLAVDRGIPVLYLDTELSKEEQLARLGASVSKVHIDALETGRWRGSPVSIENVKITSEKVEEAPLLHQYIGGFPIERSLAIMRHWLTKNVKRGPDGQFNDCLIIYDYIKMMSGSEISKLTEWQMLGLQMTEFHNFVKRFNIPMVAFAQLNRDEDVAASDRLLWFASNLSALLRKTQEEIEEDGPDVGNMILKVKHARHGPGMDSEEYINLKVNFPCFYMEEGKLKSELKKDDNNDEGDDDEEEV